MTRDFISPSHLDRFDQRETLNSGSNEMSILYLPPEVIRLTTRWVSGHDILKLLSCGTKALATKLGPAGGVEEFSIEGVTKWPSLLQHLPRLRSISVKASINSDLNNFDSSSISSLSTGLVKLEICARNAESAFAEPLTSTSPSAASSSTVFLSIKDKFPLLETLRIQGRSTMTYSTFLQQLPSSIKLLDLHYATTFYDADIKMIPTSIETLILASTALITRLGVQQLPRTLTSLDLWDALSAGSACLKYLPRTLKRLSLANFTSLNDEDIPHLPPELLILDIRRELFLKAPCLALLPRTLTEFHQTYNGSLARKPSTLPRNLTYLDWKCAPGIHSNSLQDFPRTLSTLILDQFTSDFGSCISDLPPNLTYLSLEDHRTLCDSEMESLPRSLTFLNIPANLDLTALAAFALPPNLRTLNIKSNQSFKDSNSFGALPSTVTFLALGSKEIANDSIKELPRGLLTLMIPKATNVTDEGIAQLPPALTHLEIQACASLTDFCVPSLPRSLEVLRCRSADLTEDCLPFLPQKLTILDPKRPQLAGAFFSRSSSK